jgi:hypothetical protein
MHSAYSDHQKLAEARMLRKRVDEDARLLSNRLALLKQEEQKAMKKISDTRKKTQEIIETRSRSHKEVQRLEHSKRIQEEQAVMKNEANRLERERLRSMRQQANKYRFDQELQEIKALKQFKQQNIETIKFHRFEELSEKIDKKNKVKEKLKEAENKKRRFLSERIERAKFENLKKTEEEVNVRKEKEAYLLRLEQEEMELIQRLQNTQLLQRNAYEDLECALSGNPVVN